MKPADSQVDKDSKANKKAGGNDDEDDDQFDSKFEEIKHNEVQNTGKANTNEYEEIPN